MTWGFLDSSVDKELACSARDPGSIPGSGRSAREGIGYPFWYSWACLMAQLVKNLPSMRETWVPSLDWADPLEKGKVTHSSILAWRIPWTIVHGVTKSRTVPSDFHLHFHFPGGSDGKESACRVGDPGSTQCGLQDTTEWLVSQLCPLFGILLTVARQTPLTMEFSRQGLLAWVAIPVSTGFPKLGIKSRFPALQADSSLSEPPGKPTNSCHGLLNRKKKAAEIFDACKRCRQNYKIFLLGETFQMNIRDFKKYIKWERKLLEEIFLE